MPSCEEMEHLLSDYCDGELSVTEQRRVAAHLASCPVCTALLADFRAIGEHLRRAPSLAPSPEWRRALLTRVRRCHHPLHGFVRFLAPASDPAASTLLRPLAVAFSVVSRVALFFVLVLWLGAVFVLLQNGQASRITDFSATPGTPAALGSLVVSDGEELVQAVSLDAPAPAPQAVAPELVWAHSNELWASRGEDDLRRLSVLPDPEGGLVDFVVTRDAGRVVYVLHGPAGAALRVAAIDGANSRVLLTSRYLAGLTVMPDNRRVSVFAGDAADALSLTTVDLADGSRVTFPLRAPFAFWSRDGRYIAYTEPLARAGYQRVRVVDALKGITLSEAEVALPEGYLAWAPDGSRLLFAAYTKRAGDTDRLTGPARILTLRPGDRKATPFSNAAANGEADYLRPQLSPDSRAVAFLYHPRQPGERVPQPDTRALHTDLAASGSDGKGSRALAGAGPLERVASLLWSPDARYVAYLVVSLPESSSPSGRVWLAPANGAGPRPMSPRFADAGLLARIQWLGSPSP